MKITTLILKTISLVIISCLLISVCIDCFALENLAEMSDASDTYLIYDAQTLFSFADAVNSGNTDVNAKIIADIDLNPQWDASEGTVPTTVWNPIKSFSGKFEGGGYTISGLYYDSQTAKNVGLFSSNSGEIKNLTINNFYVRGYDNVGAICGKNTGTVENCRVSDGIIHLVRQFGGGICGVNSKCILSCYVQNSSVLAEQSAQYVGGVCGSNSDTVSKCVNYSQITSQNNSEGNIGGIAGINYNLIEDCVNIGPISAKANNIGGICGYVEFLATVNRCLNVGEINGVGSTNVGGVCGRVNDATIKNCYFDSSVYNGQAVGSKNSGSTVKNTSGYGDLSDGEVSYLLSSNSTDGTWGQNIGVDAYPMPNSTFTVYECYKYSSCVVDDNGQAFYSNANHNVFGDHTDEGEDGLCDACDMAVNKIKGASISLGSDISINYYVALTVENSSATMVFKLGNNEPCIVEGKKNSDNLYVYTFSNIAPQRMGDNITAELMLDSRVIDTKAEFSIKTYCEEVLNNDADYFKCSEEKYAAMCVLVNDLLVYGGAAQNYVQYKTDKLVSDNINGSEYAMPSKSDRLICNNGNLVTFIGANVKFNNANHLIFRFEAESVENLELKLSVEDSNTITDLEIINIAEGVYEVMTPAIYATQFDTVFTITAYMNGAKGASASYNISSYVYAMASDDSDMSKLAKAVYSYGVSAQNYINAQ